MLRVPLMAAPMDPGFGMVVPESMREPATAAPAAAAADDTAERLRLAEQRHQQDAETIRTLAQRPAAAAAPVVPPVPTPPLGPQPDPTTDPAGFERWLNSKHSRMENRAAQNTEATRDAAMVQVRAREITQEFIAKHPEYATRVQHVGQELAAVVTEMGLESFPADASAIHARTAERMKENVDGYVAIKAAQESTVTDPKPPQQAAEPSRAEGTSGGSVSAPAIGTPEGDDKVVSLVDALRNDQSKSGFF